MIDKVEADDVIATICSHHKQMESIIIASNDKDFTSTCKR